MSDHNTLDDLRAVAEQYVPRCATCNEPATLANVGTYCDAHAPRFGVRIFHGDAIRRLVKGGIIR